MTNIRNNKTIPTTNTRIPRLNTLSRGRTTSSMENISVRATSDTTTKIRYRGSRPATSNQIPTTTQPSPKLKVKGLRRDSTSTSRPSTPVPTHHAIPRCPSIAFDMSDTRMSTSLGAFGRSMVAPTPLNLDRRSTPSNPPVSVNLATQTNTTNLPTSIPRPRRLAPKRSFLRPDP